MLNWAYKLADYMVFCVLVVICVVTVVLFAAVMVAGVRFLLHKDKEDKEE